MAHIGRQQREVCFDVDSGSIPADQGGASKSVPRVMQAGPALLRAGSETGGPGQAGKDLLDGDIHQAFAQGGHEEARPLRLGAQLIAHVGVDPERVDGGGVQRC